MPITLDVTHYPLVITTATGALIDDDYLSYLVALEAATLARKRAYAHVYDALGAGIMSPTQRKLQADYIVRNKAEIARCNRGTAFALRSPLIRGVLTAVQWMSPPPYPYAVVSTREEAIGWCSARLAERPVG
jgi:hypothetical protein